MQVVLHNLETGAFFKGYDDWTPNLKDALDFEDRDRAIRVAQELGLGNLELQFRSEGSLVFGVRLDQNTEADRLKDS